MRPNRTRIQHLSSSMLFFSQFAQISQCGAMASGSTSELCWRDIKAMEQLTRYMEKYMLGSVYQINSVFCCDSFRLSVPSLWFYSPLSLFHIFFSGVSTFLHIQKREFSAVILVSITLSLLVLLQEAVSAEAQLEHCRGIVHPCHTAPCQVQKHELWIPLLLSYKVQLCSLI